MRRQRSRGSSFDVPRRHRYLQDQLVFRVSLFISNFPGHPLNVLASDGADGSFVLFGEIETAFPANGGTDEIVALERRFISRHPGISTADFIQFAGAVGLSNCPGAPRLGDILYASFVRLTLILRVEFLMGRKDGTRPAPDGTVPLPFDDIGKVLKLSMSRG